MSIKDRSSRPSPTDGKDTSDPTEVEIPDRSFMRTKRGPYRSREERGWDGATYDEIGAALGITQQRVIQIERAALRKLYLAAQDLFRVKRLFDLY